MFTKTKLLAKYAKKFAAQNEMAPVLQGIHYAADGSAIITDRHHMLRIAGAHSFKSAFTVHAKTGTPLEGDYPDTSKIIPKEFASSVTISKKVLENALPSLRALTALAGLMNKAAPFVTVSCIDAGEPLRIRYQDQSKGSQLAADMEIEAKTEGKERFKCTLNANYLYDALALFHDAGYGVSIKFGKSQMEPILLTGNEDTQVLLLPVRTVN